MKGAALLWLLLGVVAAAAAAQSYREELDALEREGNYRGVLMRATELLEANAGVPPDHDLPSLLHYMGVGAYRIGRLDVAERAFENAVRWEPDDVRSWMALGDSLLNTHRTKEAAAAYEEATLRRRLTDNVSKLYHARVNMALWRDHDELTEMLRRRIRRSVEAGRVPDVGSADFSDVTIATLRAQAAGQVFAKPSTLQVAHSASALAVERGDRLRLAFLSSDYGVHPVSSLIRGVLQELDRGRFEVFCYALTAGESYWKDNITETADHFVTLSGLSTLQMAEALAADGIHIVIELNGHTLNSGLPVLSHRPAPVQMTWLGSPMTSASSFVDFFVGDPAVASPLSASAGFSEALALLPHVYMPTDHAQLQGHTPVWGRPASCLEAGIQGLDDATLVMASFSNYQKMCPRVFDAWMQLLQRTPGSKLLLLRHMGADDAVPNLLARAAAQGVLPSRIVFTPMVPWVYHTWTKSCVDLGLDTARKNGHTTVADSLWAGVPTVSVQGDLVAKRIGGALLQDLGVGYLNSHSFREYTETAAALAANPRLLARTRAAVERGRSESPVFDTAGWTRGFEQLLRSAWSTPKTWHVVTPKTAGDARNVTFHSPIDFSEAHKPRPPPPALTPDDVVLLHIGGLQLREGWTILNVNVDLNQDARRLSQYADNSVTAIYASHVVEHVNYGYGREALLMLEEWHRALKPGGLLMVGVPDLHTLASLFVNETLTLEQRYFVMRMMYGGQVDEHDFHLGGYDEEILTSVLYVAGFCRVERVDSFGLFKDTTEKQYLGVPISLNLKAVACKEAPAEEWVQVGL